MTITVDFTDTVCELLFESGSDNCIVIAGDVLINLCRKQHRSSTETLYETFLDHVFQCVESASLTINHYFFVDTVDDNISVHQKTPDFSPLSDRLDSITDSSVEIGPQFSPISPIISSQFSPISPIISRLRVDVGVE